MQVPALDIEIFQWSDKYDTGIPSIDIQHRTLVDLLNRLISHIARQSEPPVLSTVFQQLKDYTLFHFKDEEMLWQRHLAGDEWEARHHQTHAEFVTEIERLRADESRPLADVVADIASFLTHWLAYHILDNDRRLARAVLELQAGQPRAEAKRRAEEQMSGATKVLIETLMQMSDCLAQRTVQLMHEIAARQAVEEELKAANQAKSAFLANVSHEIRTPMNLIMGLTHLLRTRGDLAPDQADKVDKIGLASEHLAGVVNDVLDLSKIEAGRFVLDEREFGASDLVDRALALVGDRARARGLRLVVDTAGLPAALRGDDTRLVQMLLNYLGNAIKFTDRGTVTLHGNVVESKGREVMIRFAVEDTGCGLTVAQSARLFRAFEQTERGAGLGGSGLGLAITRHLATLMQGEVGVESTPGRGSTFWFTARLGIVEPVVIDPVQPPAQVESAERALARCHPGKRVLVVEDNDLNRALFRELLSETGLDVVLVESGARALEVLADRTFDLILMDMQMPGMDGLDTTRALRLLPTGMRVPVIALTGNALAEDRAACLAAGMNDYLAKPLAPEQLYRRLLTWLDGTRAAAERQDVDRH